MKIAFVQPYYHNVWEALGIGYIASYLRSKYEGNLELSCFQEYFDPPEYIEIEAADADIVAFSCTSPAYAPGLRIARNIKKRNPSAHIVFGGWHPTAVPEQVLSEDCVDQVVIGEGEEAFLAIARGCRLSRVQGSPLHFSAMRWPDRDLIMNQRTIALCESINGLRIASFQSNRVCPVSCVFCAESTMTGKHRRSTNPIRSRDPHDVCQEIIAVRDRFDINYFKFVDATFDVSPDHVIKFCQAKLELGIDMEWECMIHASFVQDEHVFRWLKLSNCNQINIGYETGSDKIHKDIGKGVSVEALATVSKHAKKHGISQRAFCILGMPNETASDIRATEALIDDLKPDTVGFTILCPYPGCSLYDPEEHADIDWEHTDEYSNNFWRSKYHSNDDLKWWQQHLTAKYSSKLCERQAK